MIDYRAMETARAIFFHLPAFAAALGGAVLVATGLGLPPARGRKALAVALGLALLLHAVVFLDATLSYIAFPYEGKSVVEGVGLYNSMQYLHGEQPYHPPNELPYRSLVYPPAHEMLLAAFLWIAGPSLYAARLFSLLCVLGTAVVVGISVQRHAKNRLASLFGGMLILCCYGVTGHWMEQVRSDALLMLFLALGTSLADRAVSTATSVAGGNAGATPGPAATPRANCGAMASRGRMPIGGLICFLLALFTKQVAVFAPVAAALFLWRRSRRAAVIWATSFAACAVAVFLAMEAWTDGWFSFYTLRVPASVGFEFSKLELLSTFLGSTWILLWGILVAAVSNGGQESSETGERRSGVALWVYTLGIALVFSLLQSLKWGATLNAFLPVIPVLAVLGGISLDSLLRRFRERGWGQVAIVAAALMQVALLSYQPILPTEADRRAQERIAQWVRAAPGDVFVSVFSSQAYLNGKKYFGDDVTIGDLAKASLWRGGRLIEKMQAGGFSLMILRPVLEPQDFADAVRQNYVAVERIPMRTALIRWPYMEVYVPRQAPWKPKEE